MGNRGLRFGASTKKPTSLFQSQICNRKLLELFLAKESVECTFNSVKEQNVEYSERKKEFLAEIALNNWGWTDR
jgi:hypothetical protein